MNLRGFGSALGGFDETRVSWRAPRRDHCKAGLPHHRVESI